MNKYGEDARAIKKISDLSLTKILIIILMFQFIMMPKIQMVVKLVLLITILFLTFMHRNFKLTVTHNAMLLITYALFNVFCMIMGLIKGYGKVAIRSSTVSVVWPILFLLFMGISINREWFAFLYKLLIGLTLCMCIFDTLVLVSGIYGLSLLNEFLMLFNLNRVYGSSGYGFFVIRSDHLYFYAFLIPVMMAIMFRQSKDEYRELNVSKKLVQFVCMYSMAIGVLSGMGGVWLSEALGFVICIFRYRHVSKKKFYYIFAGISVLLVYALFSFFSKGTVWYIYEEVADHIFVKSRGIEDIRGNQIRAMLDLWLSSPLFGVGNGVPVEYWREGQYVLKAGGESSYFSMLYQTGIIGVVLFFSLVVNGIKSLKSRFDAKWICDPYIVGLICFLVANAFNPYLSNLSMIWILLFPLLINKPKYGQENKSIIEGCMRC